MGKTKKVMMFGTVATGVVVFVNRKALLMKISTKMHEISLKAKQLSLYLDLAATALDIIQEHPELQDDPRFEKLFTDIAFSEIIENFPRE